MFYGIYAIVKFNRLSREIAQAQNRIEEWDQPGGEGGMNAHQIAMFEQMLSGDTPSGIDDELSTRAQRLSGHLRLSTLVNVIWVAALLITFCIAGD